MSCVYRISLTAVPSKDFKSSKLFKVCSCYCIVIMLAVLSRGVGGGDSSV